MSAMTVALELERIRKRVRGAFVASVVIHALLAILMWRVRVDSPAPEVLMEVTWLDPVVAAPAPAPAAFAGPEAEREPVLPAPRESKVNFARQTREETSAPNPQETSASRDRLRDRLATLQQQSAREPVQIAGMGASSVPSISSLAGLPGGVLGQSGTQSLARGEGRSGLGAAPLGLTRSRPGPAGAPPVLQKLQGAPSAKADAPVAASASREVLSGITLRGPVANRALVSYAKPTYPEWAQRELVEGSVRLYFEVLPDGRVKENVFVQKTSGVQDFDENATRALLRWRFEPVAEGVGEQWGTITFDFLLGGARG